MSAKHTPGPWRAESQGGSSTVLCAAQPKRNDTRIPTYAYREDGEHCIGYPFLEDREGRSPEPRRDFVCFSHDDARLIAAAPELLEACERVIDRLVARQELRMNMAGDANELLALELAAMVAAVKEIASPAIAKARGAA